MAERYISVRFPASTRPNRYYLVANLAGTQTIIGSFGVPNGNLAGSIAVVVSVQGYFTVAGSAAAMTSIGSMGLFSQHSPESDLVYDSATTSILGEAGTTISCSSR
jgi:hypothetical protein